MNKILLTTLGVISIALISHATVVGLDTASATAYDDGWDDGDDGSISGNGFEPWVLTTQGDGAAGFFIGDSTSLSSPGADINTSSESFGMFGVAGTTFTEAKATRDFNGDLLAGQTFSIELAVNFRNGSKGIDILDSVGTNLFNFNIGGDDYVVSNAASGNGSIGDLYAADTAFSISLTQVDGTGGTWSIERSGGVTDTDTGTYTGTPSAFALYVLETGGNGSPDDLYANSMEIVPEPASYPLFAGVVGLALLARRRGRS